MAKGLLDFSDPQTMGLLGISSGLLQAGGPSRMPVSLGQGFGMGLNQGMKFAEDASQMRNRERALDQRDELMKLKNDLALKGRLPQQFAPSSLGKLFAEKAALPPGTPQAVIDAYDRAIKNFSESQERSPSYQFFPTAAGIAVGDRRAGTVKPPEPGSAPMLAPAFDPALQGRIAKEKAAGREAGEAQAQAEIDLPRVIDNANNSLSLIDQMIGPRLPDGGRGKPHPGFGSAVGLRIPGATRIPGTDAANFQAMLDQVKGGAFLEAFNSLKGGGQITEVEGKKATDAITRMSNAQSEREFILAAREYQGIIEKGVTRARVKAGQSPERRSETRTTSQRVVVDF